MAQELRVGQERRHLLKCRPELLRCYRRRTQDNGDCRVGAARQNELLQLLQRLRLRRQRHTQRGHRCRQDQRLSRTKLHRLFFGSRRGLGHRLAAINHRLSRRQLQPQRGRSRLLPGWKKLQAQRAKVKGPPHRREQHVGIRQQVERIGRRQRTTELQRGLGTQQRGRGRSRRRGASQAASGQGHLGARQKAHIVAAQRIAPQPGAQDVYTRAPSRQAGLFALQRRASPRRGASLRRR